MSDTEQDWKRGRSLKSAILEWGCEEYEELAALRDEVRMAGLVLSIVADNEGHLVALP